MKCPPPNLTNSLVNNVPPSDPTEECVIYIFFSLYLTNFKMGQTETKPDDNSATLRGSHTLSRSVHVSYEVIRSSKGLTG